MFLITSQKRWMWTYVSQWKLREDFYEHIAKELYCVFIFFQNWFVSNRSAVSVIGNELSRQMISDCIPEVALSSVFKLLNSRMHKVYAVKQIAFCFSSFQFSTNKIKKKLTEMSFILEPVSGAQCLVRRSWLSCKL